MTYVDNPSASGYLPTSRDQTANALQPAARRPGAYLQASTATFIRGATTPNAAATTAPSGRPPRPGSPQDQDGSRLPQLGDFAKVFEFLDTSSWPAPRRRRARHSAGEDVAVPPRGDAGRALSAALGPASFSRDAPARRAFQGPAAAHDNVRRLASGEENMSVLRDAKRASQPLPRRTCTPPVRATSGGGPHPQTWSGPGPVSVMPATPPATPRPDATLSSRAPRRLCSPRAGSDADPRGVDLVGDRPPPARMAFLLYKTSVSSAVQPLALPVMAKEQQRQAIRNKLDQRLRVDRLVGDLCPQAASTIHVFVDMSNIIIGFYKTLAAIYGLPSNSRFAPAPDFNFEHLAQAMERGRHVSKAVVVGSVHPGHTRRPSYFDQAQAEGYVVDVRRRIPRTHDGAVDDSAGSDSGRGGRMREDRIDEAIHLQMSESILDASRPGTIVLATGDAARAEASGGFLCFVERALKRGWVVEVVSWRTSLSSAWLDRDWRAAWGHSFTVLELDPIVKELVAV